MFRKKDEESALASSAPSDETAYEDNWYRSLKARSEQPRPQPTQGKDEVPVEAGTEDETPVEAGTEDETPVGAGTEDETPVEAGTEDETPVEAGSTDGPAPSEGLEDRAGRLLERLRSLQRLRDEPEPAPEAEEPSVWG